MTLEELLRTKVDINGTQGSPDFRIAVQEETLMGVKVIIHPMNHTGVTLDLMVSDNEIIPLTVLKGE